MIKFSEKRNKTGFVVKAHVPMEYEISLNEINNFISARLEAFMKPEVGKFRNIIFTGYATEKLSNRLNRIIDSVEFYYFIRQIIDASYALDGCRFNQRRCIWDINNIYVNGETGQLKFLYLPVMNYTGETDVRDLILKIIEVAKPASEEVQNDIFSFSLYIREMQSFSKDRVVRYLNSINKGGAQPNIKENLPNSGFITDKRTEYYHHYSKTGEDEGTELFGQNTENESAGIFDEEGTQLFSDNPYSTANNYHDRWQNNNSYDDEQTGVLSSSGVESNECQETTLLEENSREQFDSSDELIAQRIHYPVLYRKSTNERITVDKPVYRIGKEKKYVDYFVANNGAVSRSHADIITRGNKYFIIDLNSKNKTFINGRVIPVHTEIRLEDGDAVRLGNEDFVFYF